MDSEVTMKIGIRYGNIEEMVELKGDVTIATSPGKVETPPDGGNELIRQALSSPIGTPTLRELAREKQRVTIIVSDHTRPTPSWRIVPLLLDELQAGGIRKEQVTIVVATGTHDASSPDALQRMLGKELLSSLVVRVHDCDDVENLVPLGVTRRGTPLSVNRAVAEADLVLSVSVVEPHRLFGWSGGAKNVIPGVSARTTVNVHHGRYKTDPGGLDVIDGNAFREDAEAAARMAHLAFILNCVLNEKREVVGAFAGDPVAAHRAAVAMGRRLNRLTIPSKVDLVVCGVGGPPRDQDFWQAQGKGLMPVQHAVREGGVVILAASCEMGMGTALFAKLLKGSFEDIERWSQEQGYSTAMEKVLLTIDYLKRGELFLVTAGLSAADFPRLPIRLFPTIQEAVEEALRKVGKDARILVAPDASRIVIAVKDQTEK
jgi:lactate racemase